MIKEAYIKKLPSGKYRVFSEKGRPFGTYSSKEKAKKRLQQMEMFKSLGKKKKSNTNYIFQKLALAQTPAQQEDLTYSSMMRQLRLQQPEKVNDFQKAFHQAFHESVNLQLDYPEKIALMQAIQKIK